MFITNLFCFSSNAFVQTYLKLAQIGFSNMRSNTFDLLVIFSMKDLTVIFSVKASCESIRK